MPSLPPPPPPRFRRPKFQVFDFSFHFRAILRCYFCTLGQINECVHSCVRFYFLITYHMQRHLKFQSVNLIYTLWIFLKVLYEKSCLENCFTFFLRVHATFKRQQLKCPSSFRRAARKYLLHVLLCYINKHANQLFTISIKSIT